MKYEVRHNIAENQFEVIVDNLKSVIDYTIDKESNTITITHTGVPPELEGRGIAASLTKELLSYASTHSFKVIPMCSYAQVYIERHPEWQHLLG